MEYSERELLVARICSGTISVKLDDKKCLIRNPSPSQNYIAQEIYHDSLRQAAFDGAYSDKELLQLLYEKKLWDKDSNTALTNLPKEIDEIKLNMYTNIFRSNQRSTYRKALAKAKEKLVELTINRNKYNHLSCSGLASIARTRYLVSVSFYMRDTNQAIDFSDKPSWYFNEALKVYGQSKLTEKDYRELCRTDPWRSIWSCRKSDDGIFGLAAINHTEEQRSLICWSEMYDSVYGHNECPPDNVIDDDDLLDGWMVKQRRLREKSMTQQSSEELISNEKIRNASEVYLVADTVEDARRIDDLNDERSAAIKKQRFAKLRQDGVVNELDMPDTRRELVMQITNKLSQTMEQRK